VSEDPAAPPTTLTVIEPPQLPRPGDAELADMPDASTFGLMPRAVQLARVVKDTAFVSKEFRGRPDAITAAILVGHELGISPMQSLQHIHVTEDREGAAGGKVIIDIVVWRTLVRSRGHSITFPEYSAVRVTARGTRHDNGDTLEVTWALEDARRAGLDQRPIWKKYPRAMLMARATAELCRGLFEDVIGGIAYATEEMTDGFAGVRDVVDEPDEDAPAATPETTTRQAPVRRRRVVETTTGNVSVTVPVPTVPSPAPEAATSPPPEEVMPSDGPVGEAATAADPGPTATTPAVVPPQPAPAGAPSQPELIPVPGDEASSGDENLASHDQVRQVAMLARELGTDRAALCSFVSEERTSSSRELTPKEATRAIDILHGIGRGEWTFEGTHVDNVPTLAMAERLAGVLAQLNSKSKDAFKTVIVAEGYPLSERPEVTQWLRQQERGAVLRMLSAARAALHNGGPS